MSYPFATRRMSEVAACLVALLLVMAMLPSERAHAFAQFFSEYRSVTEADKSKHPTVFNQLKSIPDDHIRIVAVEDLAVIRVEGPERERFCIHERCLTFVTLACRAVPCPSASALAPPDFMISDEVMQMFDGGANMIFFFGKGKGKTYETMFLVSDGIITVRDAK